MTPRTVIIIFALLIALPLVSFFTDSYTGKVSARTAIYAHHDSTMMVDLHSLIDADEFVLFEKGKLNAELSGSVLTINPSAIVGIVPIVIYADNNKIDIDVVEE